MTWILVMIAIVHGVGIGWGLPASDGWDNDGVAPRDFLPGLAASFTPGQFYTYPPVHIAVLAVLTLPITCIALLRAPSLAIHDVVSEIIKVPYMTAMASVARVIALFMSLGIVLFVARTAEELRAHELGIGPREMKDDARVRIAGYCAAAFTGVNASLTYYAHTSNLDVPYLFWATWSLLTTTRAIARRDPRLLRRALALAVLAVGTKDQAYAIFLLSLPIAIGSWIMLDPWAREHRRTVLREMTIAVACAILLLAIVDCAIVNPTGFRARVAFLTGSASQDYVEYTNDWPGRIQILLDGARKFHLQYPVLLAPALVLGVVRAIIGARSRGSSGFAIALLPLLAAVSFTATFNWTARRTDPRFLLPQAIILGVYGGLAIDWLVTCSKRALRIAGQAAVSVALANGIFICVSVDVNMLRDPRYDTEAWLAAHVRPGDTIETYGLNVYMPRMANLARVVRVGPEPLEKRNPMPGVEEVQASFERAPDRDARFIVVSTAWVWRYFVDPEAHLTTGKQIPPTQSRSATDAPAVRFFEELARSAGAFVRVHESKYDDSVFPVVDIHGTTTRWVWIFERKPR